ncbi:hypothetical protein ISCGN_029983 [Ixodes scapularis]
MGSHEKGSNRNSASPTIELTVFKDPVEMVACSRADLRHTKVMSTVDPTCVDVVVAPLFMVLNMIIKGPVPLTEEKLQTLTRQLVLKRAWDLQLAVFPGTNPTKALYVPQDAKVPGPVAALLNFIGDVFNTCDGFDHLVAGPLRRVQQIPEYWKPQPDLWMAYRILQAVFSPRFYEPGLSSRTPAQKPLLSESNIQGRLRLARVHEDWTRDDWGRVIFSDESTFTTQWDQGVPASKLPVLKVKPKIQIAFSAILLRQTSLQKNDCRAELKDLLEKLVNQRNAKTKKDSELGASSGHPEDAQQAPLTVPALACPAEEAEPRANKAKTRAGETRASEAKTMASEAEARASEAEVRAPEAKVWSSEAEVRASEAETRDSEAEARAGPLKTDDAEARAEVAEARAEEATTKAEEVEARTSEAEARAAPLKTEDAVARADEATTRAEEAEVRAEEAETKVVEGKAQMAFMLYDLLFALERMTEFTNIWKLIGYISPFMSSYRW